MTASDRESEFVDRVLETIARHDLLLRAPSADRETVIVGASGGPDSVALVRVLAHLVGEGRLAVTPVLAHLHHGVRAETADADQAFVEALADRLGLPLETGRADVPAEPQADGVGIEEAGRGARRRFLAEAARRRGARTVALGHHGGDRVETVLFHILRGTGIDGLAALGPRSFLPSPSMGEGGRDERPGEGECAGWHGHPMVGGHVPGQGPWPRKRGHATPSPYPLPPGERDRPLEIVRPMMHPDIGREEVLAYLRHIGQPWREDETNRDRTYTRNRLRHEVLPMLARTVNPAVGRALWRLADQAEAVRQVLDEALDRVWRRIVREAPPDDVISTEASRSAVPRGPAGNLDVGEHKDARPRRDASVPQAGSQYDSASGGGPRAILIDADDFAALAPWLQGALVRRAVERLGGGLKHMSAARTEDVVSALVAKTVAGPVDLPGGLAAERRRRAIRIGPKRAPEPQT